MKRRSVGIMGGSFNPIHTGHMMVASYIAQTTQLDEVWLSLSPANPLKQRDDSTTDAERLDMMRIAVDGSTGLGVTDIELTLPYPSYTLRLLDTLAARYPDTDFRLIIGSDNWLMFDKWRDPERILSDYGVIIYPRPGYDITSPLPAGATMVNAPTVDLSSTFVREAIKNGLDMNYFLPTGVYKYIKEHNLYR
ncbi:MAG: nicotinate-nucleotide adenylyltransferase [Muribaculaceae bacterium]|nr:nicotinate-nucleotide adenylyltransferase [Muribaculaceae bacterium]